MKQRANPPKKKKQNKKSSGPRSTVSRSAPVSVTKVTTGRPPAVRGSKHGCIINHRELLTAVDGSVLWEVEAFRINPGLSDTFPWLWPFGGRYEMYQFHKLVLEYIPFCPTTTPGLVGLAVDFDVLDTGPDSFPQFSGYDGMVSGASWCPFSCDVNRAACQYPNKRLFNRITTYPAGSDPKTYDLGRVLIAREGQASEASIGYVWVDYEVEFFIPDNVDLCIDGKITATTYDATHVFGNGTPVGNLVTEVMNSGQQIRFMEGFEGLVSANLQGTGMGAFADGVNNQVTTLSTINNTANSAGTNAILTRSIRALAGQILHQTLTAGTTTGSATWIFTPQSYVEREL